MRLVPAILWAFDGDFPPTFATIAGGNVQPLDAVASPGIKSRSWTLGNFGEPVPPLPDGRASEDDLLIDLELERFEDDDAF